MNRRGRGRDVDVDVDEGGAQSGERDDGRGAEPGNPPGRRGKVAEMKAPVVVAASVGIVASVGYRRAWRVWSMMMMLVVVVVTKRGVTTPETEESRLVFRYCGCYLVLYLWISMGCSKRGWTPLLQIRSRNEEMAMR